MTAGGPQDGRVSDDLPRSAWSRLRAMAASERRSELLIWVFSLGMLLAAVPITIALRDLEPLVSSPAPFLALLALFLLVEVLRVDIALGPHSHSFTMSEFAVTVALMTGQPAEVVVAETVAVALFFGLYRRVPLLKLTFNLGQVAIVTAVAAVVFHVIAPDELASVGTVVAALTASLVLSALEALAVTVVIQLSPDGSNDWDLGRTLVYGMVVAVTSTTVGIQAVFLGRVSPILAPLAAVPLLLAYAAYRGYVNERRMLQQSDFVHRAALALHEQSNLDDGLLALLDQTRAAVRAEFVRVVLFTPEGALTVVAREVEGTSEPMHSVAPQLSHAAHLLMLSLAGPTPLNVATAPAKALFAELDVRDGLAAPLFQNGERTGLIIIGNRLGNLDEFRKDDHDVISLVGNQISVALERGWLQQSLRKLLDLEAQLAYQANHDGLTGLANRRLFNERLDALFSTERTSRGGALLLVDLDDFKSVNDSFGHVVGDDLLVSVAKRLSSLVRPGDLVARIGGDEFALVLDGVHAYHLAEQRAANVVESIELPVLIDDREVSTKASVGIALTGEHALTTNELQRNADLALYHAKGLGKGRYAVFQPSMSLEAEERKLLIAELSSAVGNGELDLHYQPVYDLVTGELAGAEALLRWHHPQLGEVQPAMFLPLAEETGLIAPIGEWVLRTALQVAAPWIATNEPRRFTISVNLSARQLQDASFVDVLVAELQRTGIPPSALVLEITESAIIEDLDRTRRVVDELSELGVCIALDDFGTGYSSLSHVHNFPFDQLKIDRSFVGQLSASPGDSALVGSIIHLAEALGVTAVAEGIETAEQLAELRRQGCRFGQGFLMSQPVPAAELTRLMDGADRSDRWLTVG